MLQDLRRKDSFYETYVKTTDELTKLRQAHTILISLIQTNKLNIGKKEMSAQKGGGDTLTDRLLGSSTVDKHELTVPTNNNNNNYRGGTSAQQLSRDMQNQHMREQQQIGNQNVKKTNLFCGYGNNSMVDQTYKYKPTTRPNEQGTSQNQNQ